MQNTIYIWKPVGLTPLEIVEKFKEINRLYKNETISYAGRLDPMAEGILVLLVNDENKNRDKYLRFKKEYETEIVLGISTDTFDSLGLITNINFKEISNEEIESTLKSFTGKQKQIYPPFSSKAINGKPLYWWTRNNKLSEIKIPERDIEIYSIELLNIEKIAVGKCVGKILKQIENIKGNFRQKEIMECWEKFADSYKENELIKIRIKISCSSGTYIRRIADDLGKKMGTFAFAYSIKRTKLGKTSEREALKII